MGAGAVRGWFVGLAVALAIAETGLWLFWALPALESGGDSLSVGFRRVFAVFFTVPFVLCTVPAWVVILRRGRPEYALLFVGLAIPVFFATLWLASL